MLSLSDQQYTYYPSGRCLPQRVTTRNFVEYIGIRELPNERQGKYGGVKVWEGV